MYTCSHNMMGLKVCHILCSKYSHTHTFTHPHRNTWFTNINDICYDISLAPLSTFVIVYKEISLITDGKKSVSNFFSNFPIFLIPFFQKYVKNYECSNIKKVI